MNCLIDTHVFLWWTDDKTRLSPLALNTMLDVSNTLVLSAASIWELAIKLRLSKLQLKGELSAVVEAQTRVNRIEILPISAQHALKTLSLPLHHKDPFDRMLVAQALSEGLAMITADTSVSRYDIQAIW